MQTHQARTPLAGVLYQKLDESRSQILDDLNCPDATLIFISGATEAH